MPSIHEDALWEAVNKKEYEKVKKLITDHPELVNAVNSNGRTLLMRVVLALVPPLDLIQFIAIHPDLSFENKSLETTQTTVGAILSTGRPDILEIFAKDPRIIFDSDQLAYTTAKKNLERATKGKVENYTKMLIIIRDATIRHAIATDNPTLLERLENEGDNLSNALSDGKLPVRLITKENPAPKVKLWFQSQIGKNGTSIGTHVDSFFVHTHEMQKTKEQMEELNRRKLEDNIKLLDKTYTSTLESMDRVVSTISLSS
ncbi:hypothetical protein LEAN103870_10390 [Legionella anisa]|uniref:Ankyrin repeat domain-containing protein n=1 Tax=Legionella anisa TaxID=28082 RepID=A0AAX0WV19_9GAMM|nr:hypothetical protein [Legionella anisa]AWN73627.1 hypothetical protein DLD14_07145 [Legionella anisa]KTC75743.1 hypothetical protein Lani_0566 [Legionella anisa]MBN5935619.1 hypothetical protein [Legionella anisa]MCW8426520.1 hypothetical protein [Legionella anisa]MCW8448183.1 hypothetical protein [Legionella anisa]